MVTAVGNVARDIALVPDTTLIKGLIPQRTTLDTLLRGHGVADDAAVGVVQAAARVFDPAPPAVAPAVLARAHGRRRAAALRVRGGSRRPFLRVKPAAPGAAAWTAELVPIPRTLEHAVTAGRIDRDTPSLFQAMDAAGEEDQLAVDLAGIFSGEVDFNSELQPGDGFALAFERYTRENGAATYGDITAAEFRNDGRVLRAIRFTPPGGKPGYYDEAGRSLRRFFLRSPLKFEPRITSRFSSSRRHPVLHTARAHRGVDYAAPVGAPVIAAAGGIGGVGDARRRQRPHGAAASRVGLRVALSAPVGVRARASAPEIASSRATPSASWDRRAWPPARTCTTRSPRTARS